MAIGGQSVSVEVGCSGPSLPLPLPGERLLSFPFRASA